MPEPRELIEQGMRYEAGGVLDRALSCYSDAASNPAAPPRVRAEALRRQADVLRSRCDWEEAIEKARLSAALASEHRLETLLAEAMNAEAAVHQSRGDLDRAQEIYQEMLGLTPDLRIRGIALQNLGSIDAMHGDYLRAEERFVESFQCFQAADYQRGVVIALNNYGRAALDRHADAIAHPVLERAEQLARALMDLDLLALARLNLAESHLRRDAIDAAQDLASAALGHFANTRNQWRRLECLRLLGDIAIAQQRPGSARNFFEAALRVAHDIGAPMEAEHLDRRLASLTG